MSRLRRVATAAAATLLATTLTACEGAYDLPLPGGAAGGDDVYRVTVEFADVLDLVPQSAVKVNDVTVGAVEDIELVGWHAKVHLRLLDSVRLPDNAVAELRQTSLLGEKFVSLGPPPGGGAGRLKDGDSIPLERSGRNPEVEEVFAALSLLLNGGGVAQLKTINVELTKAMRGHEADIKGAIKQLDTFISGLDEHKSEIVRAIDGLDRLSARLAEQKDDIAIAIEDLGPGLTVLADQREQLTEMLTALSDLGRVGTRVIRASKADTVANLRALDPILTRLSEAGDNLPGALEMLVTYPFPRAATGAVKGDYTNLRVTADLDLRTILGNGGGPKLPDLPPVPNPTGSSIPVPGVTTLPNPVPSVTSILPGVPDPVSTSLPVPDSGGTSGGTTCLPGTSLCLGSGARTSTRSYDVNLVGLLMGGLL
ncbi:MAG TPA: MCE family protein [Nocardioidaceae bacterium]|nr:MCE family protein [Nocardioidaceae bacterium]